MFKNDPADMAVQTSQLTGFWRGVVEDNNDPLKAGRVRVRILGLHTPSTVKDDFDGIPVSELPWAEPCLPISEGSISGFGSWGIPVQGSHVMCFFESNNLSAIRYFASMPGITEDTSEIRAERSNPDRSQGFKDPDNVYPTLTRLGEADVHRLARGISEGTLVETRNDNRDIGVPQACGGSWDEPESAYDAEYPDNWVTVTHGGITIELDSTPGSTRLNVYHPSNSFIEIDNDGVMVVKNNDSRYEVVLSDNNIHIKRDRSLTTDGNYKRLTQGDECVEVDGNRTEKIAGDETRNIGGDVDETIGGNETRNIGGNVDETIDKNETRNIGGDVDITIEGGLNGLIKETGTVTIEKLQTLTGNGTIEVSTTNLNFDGGAVQAGSSGATRYVLMDERMIDVYNNHKHYSGSGLPEPPLLATGSHTTTNFEAS
jgi:hypothetical protein